MKKFYYSCQATTHFLIFTDCIRYYYWLKDGIEALRDNRLYYVNMFQAVVFFFFGIFFYCVMKNAHIGYQKCITILRVTLLRNHMSRVLIFVDYNLISFREICQHSHNKSPPGVVCLSQALLSSLVWKGTGDLRALN